jgi:phenylpyruvate tautomerase PptA (4-oxalocrotonate tautomerase family)
MEPTWVQGFIVTLNIRFLMEPQLRGGELYKYQENKEVRVEMPLVEITLLELPQESKERIAKAITEILAEEEKKVFKLDTTAITVVAFRELPMTNLYLGGNPLAKVIETLPKA